MVSFQLPASTALMLMLVGALLANQIQLRSELHAHREEYRKVREEHREEYARMQEEHQGKYRRMQDELQSLREELDTSEEAFDDVNGAIVPYRHLFGTHSVATAAGATTGCFSLSASVTLTLSSATACTKRCPPCFINTGTGGVILTLNDPGTSIFKSSAFSGVRQFMFINAAASGTFTVRSTPAGAATNRDYVIAPYASASAMVQESNNYFLWQSNYGLVGDSSGVGISVCPDGCNAGTVYAASDSTSTLSGNTNL
jgi:hypothetical protein